MKVEVESRSDQSAPPALSGDCRLGRSQVIEEVKRGEMYQVLLQLEE